MMVGWSVHKGHDDPSGGRAISYFLASRWRKKLPGGEDHIEVRDPSPEILEGDPRLVARTIRSLKFQNRYTSCVLSFEKDDIDIMAFNHGSENSRTQIRWVVERFKEVAFAGLKSVDWPPMLVSTHTHTGRLEINILIPRSIDCGDKIYAFNPAPPGQENTETWDAFRDVCNWRFGWANPDDPARRQAVKVPDFIQKQKAALKRMGRNPGRDTRETVTEFSEQLIRENLAANRDELIAAFRKVGFGINRISKKFVTVIMPDGQKIRLRGPYFEDIFTSVSALNQTPNIHSPEKLPPEARRNQLQAAEKRLSAILEKRAAFNRKKYGSKIDAHRRTHRQEMREPAVFRPHSIKKRRAEEVLSLTRSSASKRPIVQRWQEVIDKENGFFREAGRVELQDSLFDSAWRTLSCPPKIGQ